MMRTSTPWWLLATLGVLSVPALAADPSQWKCEQCPAPEEGVHGSVDVGAGYVSKDSAKFGDFTGLDRKGGFPVLGGSARYRGKEGVYGGIAAEDLGLDARSLVADHGREGRYYVWLGYDEIPHRLSDTAQTPFIGSGGPTLTLPAGFPAATTADMPLAASLQDIDIGFKRKRLDVGGNVIGGAAWTYRVDVRRDERDGTQRGAGSFFSSASQFALPLDQVTDRLDATAAYNGRRLQLTFGYHASLFRNRLDSLTWDNPFTAGVVGASSGQLALAPDNEFHQLSATVGYQFSPALRASGELALGRMTQDAGYLAPTLNPALTVPALPATSLHGRANTLDATVRVSLDPVERLRLTAVLSRNERDNETASLLYPSVSTDMFLGFPRTNQPYSFTRDRLRLLGDYRGPASWKFSAGAEYDRLGRTLQETGETREATLWGRASVRPLDNVTLAAKVAHAERDNSGYAALASLQPENPLLRKYNMADRRRDSVALRGDATLGEKVSVGVGLDWADDDYHRSVIGLQRARNASLSADAAYALSDETRLRAYAQAERVRSRQAGSEQFGAPDWTGRNEDEVDTVGFGVTHAALAGKLQLGADLTWSRSRSDVSVQTGASASPFPTAKTSVDGVRVSADYKLKDNLSLLGGYWYERYEGIDWRLDGLLPSTVPNLLAFGELAPRYHVNVVRVAVRYRF